MTIPVWMLVIFGLLIIGLAWTAHRRLRNAGLMADENARLRQTIKSLEGRLDRSITLRASERGWQYD